MTVEIDLSSDQLLKNVTFSSEWFCTVVLQVFSCRWDVVLSMVWHTPAESKWFIFSSVNMGGGRVCAVACVLGVAGIKMMMMGVLGCRCTESRGGDLGHGGDCREEPAICLGPWGGDPASLFSLTGYAGVTGRARPPGWGPEWGVWALWTPTIKRMKM